MKVFSPGKPKALFANSGLLGHQSVAKLIEEAVAGNDLVDPVHVNLSGSLSLYERLVRRALCVHPISTNHDLARWRMELNMGWLARRRIKQLEVVQGRFSLFHLHPQALAYCLINRMRQTPVIVSIDATQHLPQAEASPSEAWSFRPGFAHDKAVFAAAKAVICTSQWAADHVNSLDARFARKTHVMPYPVHVAKFPERWLADRRQRFSLDGCKPVVLFVGGDFHRKGGQDLLDAWERARLWERASLVLLTGVRLERNSLSPGITVLSSVKAYSEKWFRCWFEADIFVLPTRSEAFGMVLQEAAAAGLPVVSTGINAIPEIVTNGLTGILLKPRDVEGLGRALQQLLADSEMRFVMGTRGREQMKQMCDPITYRSRLLALIESALA